MKTLALAMMLTAPGSAEALQCRPPILPQYQDEADLREAMCNKFRKEGERYRFCALYACDFYRFRAPHAQNDRF